MSIWVSFVSSCSISPLFFPSCVLGLGAFKLLGGGFWRIAPSSYVGPGSYARNPMPGYQSRIKRVDKAQLVENYKRNGCHTCGSKVGDLVGDHNPPISMERLTSNPVYEFYPHCDSCSHRQGGILSAALRRMDKELPLWRKIWFLRAAGGGENAYDHGFQPRLYHLAGSI